MKVSLLILCLLSVLISSCGTNPTISASSTLASTELEASTAVATFTPLPTETISPTQFPTMPPPVIAHATNEPRFIVSLAGDGGSLGSDLVFSPDGRIILQANSSVKLWNVNTHELIHELKFPYSEKYYATRALFSPDGNFIAVSITDYLTHLGEPNGHLLVWNVSTGELQQDWVQDYAVMSAYDGFGPEPRVYNIPVDAMTFFPASTKLAYATGNRIEIRDVLQGGESIGWSLGDAMYASEISIRGDSEFLNILMKWYKDLTFPALYRWKFKAEIWHPATKTLRREIKFEEVYPTHADMWLVGQSLLHEDTINGTLDVLDLSEDKSQDFPYRIGWKYFNSDASLMLVIRYIGIDVDKQDIEIWNTDTWRNIYTFKPSFVDNWHFVEGIAFSPDNSLLAIDYDGQLSLWDTRQTTQP